MILRRLKNRPTDGINWIRPLQSPSSRGRQRAKNEEVLMYRCSVLTGHRTGAKIVTIYWYVGALCWTEKINTSSEREQGSSGVNVKTKDWH